MPAYGLLVWGLTGRTYCVAKDYVEGMWLMLQQEAPEDFVLATGETHPVREFVEKAFAVLGYSIKYVFILLSGARSMLTRRLGGGELARLRRATMRRPARSSSRSTPNTSVPPKSSMSPSLPLHWHALNLSVLHSLLLGDPAKAEKLLGWKRKVAFNALVQEMVTEDLKASSNLVEDQN